MDDNETNSQLSRFQNRVEISELRDEYQSIHADVYLRARIMAEVKPSSSQFDFRLVFPIGSLLMLLVFVVFNGQQHNPKYDDFSYLSNMPSFSATLRVFPDKPNYIFPGIGQLSNLPTLAYQPVYDNPNTSPETNNL